MWFYIISGIIIVLLIIICALLDRIVQLLEWIGKDILCEKIDAIGYLLGNWREDSKKKKKK